MTAILNRVRWYLIAILICISQIISNRASFHVSIGHLYIFLVKMYLGLPLKFIKLEGRYIGEQNEDAVVQLLSHVWLFATALTVEPRVLSSTISWTLLTFMSIELVMLSYHLILCRALILLPSLFPSIRVFPNEWALHIRWPNYWSFNFSISPSSEYSGLISFRIDWFDLHAAQGTLKRLFQHHSWKASIISTQPSLCSNSKIYWKKL